MSQKSVDDQLKELNSLDKSDIEWRRDGEIIVPKTIKVYRFNRANFSKSLVFKRIKREFYDALYKKSFILNTQNVPQAKGFIQNDFSKLDINVEDVLRKESDNIKQYRSTNMLPRGTIVMVASKLISEWFKENGYGLGEYYGWYLCDGRNGTPDLRAKFIVGWDNLSNITNNYSSVGNKGGNSFVSLTENELPRHNHVDNGHTHYINLTTDTFSGFTGLGGIIPQGKGVEYSLFGKPFTVPYETQGVHSHTVSGNTKSANASISYSGQGAEFDIRPPYYTLAYIIYLAV